MLRPLGLLGMILALVMIALLLACASTFNASTDGLLLVGSQGSGLLQTFSFTLNNGHVANLVNSVTDTTNETCVLNGLPGPIVFDGTGSHAYSIITKSTLCGSTSKTGIATFNISSDGNTTQTGGLTPFKSSVVPYFMSRDSSGKFLFIADRANPSGPGAISVFSIGSGGALTEVAGSPFAIPPAALTPDIISVAASPTSFPGIGINGTQNAVCSAPGTIAPTTEYLYAVDTVNYVVWEFSVNTSTGALGNPPSASQARSFPTDPIPAGVAVDPCDRFLYVSDAQTNKISEYTMCVAKNTNGTCPVADGSLVPIAGSPLAVTGSANGPGPLVVDPYGNNVYVLDTLSNTVSQFKISSVTGALTALSPATVATGVQPMSIAIRSDDNWLFVTNYGAATVSQYSVTPATGLLSAAPPIDTDNLPWGVAVK